MNDAGTLKRKMLLNILSSPATVLPFVAGVTALVFAWATGSGTDLGVLGVVAGVFGSAGVFFTKLLLGGEGYAKQAIEEIQEKEHAEGERALDDLDKRLCADKDPRTEAALRDLRSLMRAFDELKGSTGQALNVLATTEIASGVKGLFDQCVRSLEQSLRLWCLAESLKTRAARDPILKQREDIVLDVGKSIRQLGEVLVAIQNLGASEGVDSELARVGKELDQHLAMARQVEQRVKTFENQIEARVKE